MKKTHLLIVLLPLVFLSCKKKEFPDNVTEPAKFYFKATINGEEVSYAAGQNNYYMYSGFTQDSMNLYHFTAELKNKDCGSSNVCSNSIRFEISDDTVSTFNGTSHINNSIKPGNYVYANNATATTTISGYAVSFRSLFNKQAFGYSWDFGDGNVSNLANPTHTFNFGGIYNTCVNVTDSSGESSICNKIKVTTATNICQTIILIGAVNFNTINFSQYTTGTGPFNYNWDFGDGFYSTQASPAHTYSTTGLYLVKLRVKDALNHSASFNYFINTQYSNQAAPNFSVTSVNPIYTTVVPNLFSRVKIIYTDASGVQYTSKINQQPASSNFTIESVENYETNQQGNQTKKIKVKFNCEVYNGSVKKQITNAEAIFAVSYK